MHVCACVCAGRGESGQVLYHQKFYCYIIVPSSSPLELSHRNVTSTSFTLLWKPPLPENQNGQLTAYMVNFTNINSHEFQIFTTNSTFLDITLLDPFTLYSGSVSASTAVGFGPASEHHFIQTAEDGKRDKLLYVIMYFH